MSNADDTPQIVFATGHIPDPPDDRDHPVDMSAMDMEAVAHIVNYDIFTDTNGRAGYKKKVLNQHNCGTCTCNAVAAAYLYELQRQKVDISNFSPSRLFLYYVARYARLNDKDQFGANGVPSARYYDDFKTKLPQDVLVDDSGCSPRDVIKIMSVLGAPREIELKTAAEVKGYHGKDGTWPYDNVVKPDQNTKKYQSDDWPAKAPDAACYGNDMLHKALNYARPGSSVECWKACIYKGFPIVFGFWWFDSFNTFANDPKKTNFVVPVPGTNEHYQGGHTVLAVGWDDRVAGGCFRVQNSWGDWADGGFYWMPYKWLSITALNDSPWTLMAGVKPSN